jgi:hypothetical protein
MFLAYRHLSSGRDLRECKDQRWFNVQSVIIFRFYCCKMFSLTPVCTLAQVKDHSIRVLLPVCYCVPKNILSTRLCGP